jgi:hypothetical protein
MLNTDLLRPLRAAIAIGDSIAILEALPSRRTFCRRCSTSIPPPRRDHRRAVSGAADQ